jgi:hypothetical protein
MRGTAAKAWRIDLWVASATLTLIFAHSAPRSLHETLSASDYLHSPGSDNHLSLAEESSSSFLRDRALQLPDIGKDVDKTTKKVKKMNPREMIYADIELALSYLMPGKKPDLSKKAIEFTFVIMAICWLLYYREFLYQNDRAEGLDRWDKKKGGDKKERSYSDRAADKTAEELEAKSEKLLAKSGYYTGAATSHMRPDVVLVFHRPDFEYSDNDKQVHPDILKSAICDEASLPRAAKLNNCSRKGSVFPRSFHSAAKRAKTMTFTNVLSTSAEADVEKQDEDETADKNKDEVLEDKDEEIAYLPKEIDGVVVLEKVGSDTWCATKNEKKEKETGLGLEYRYEKQLDATREAEDASERLYWGKTIKGSDEGDGWVKVEKANLTYLNARKAIFQDLYEALPEDGFEVFAFSSIDDDEVFVCVSLKDEKELKHHAQRNALHLQLDPKFIQEKLEIDDPEDYDISIMSPPFVKYDSSICKNMLGDDGKDEEVFRSFKHFTNNEGSIIIGTDRIRIIMQKLNACFNLDYAVERGLIVKWYPAHTLERMHLLKKSWANWHALRDLSCVQPVPFIQEYYSSRVAFVFAWNGIYCKWLIALIPVALVFSAINMYARLTGKNSFWNRGSLIGFSMVVAFWARIVANSWRREQQYFMALWCLDDKLKDASIRPDFEGQWTPSPIDGKEKHLVYSPTKYKLRQACAWTITLAFCMFVFGFIQLWLQVFAGSKSLAAPIIQALMIQVFTQIFNWMAEALTIAENHKFQRDFYNSYLCKMFIFQLVNQYSAFLYTAVKQQFDKRGCPEAGCVEALRMALPPTLAVLAFLRIVQVVVATLQVRILLWLEDREFTKKGELPPKRSFVEVQGKYGPYRTREQIEAMTSLCLTLGFVLVFGGVVPVIVPLCFIVFTVQLRASAVLVTSSVNRPVPRRTAGIGPWLPIVDWLMNMGVLFTGYLMVNFGPLFQGTAVLTKLTGLIVYVMFVQLGWLVIDILIPHNTSQAELLESRRNHVAKKLAEKNQDALFSRMETLDSSRSTEVKAEETRPWSQRIFGHDSPKSPNAPKSPGNKYEKFGRLSRQHTHSSLAGKVELREEIATGRWHAIPRMAGLAEDPNDEAEVETGPIEDTDAAP